MTRLNGLVLAAGLCMGLAAAHAAPPVLDRIPADAAMVVAAPSLDRLEKSAKTLSTTLDQPLPFDGVQSLLKMGGIEKGIDSTKSLALVIFGPKAGQTVEEWQASDEPPMVVLVPTTDFKALTGNFADAKAEGDITEISLDGNPAFVKSAGDGYAVVGADRALVASFVSRPGNLKAHEAALGKTLNSIADESDVVFLANLAVLRPVIAEGMKGAFSKMADQMAMMGGAAAPDMEAVEDQLGKFLDQSKMAAIGARAEGAGVSLDFGASFIEGSELAKTFSTSGDTASLIKKLPMQPYFMLVAMDLSSPGLKGFMKQMASLSKAPGAEKAPEIFMSQIDAMDGQAVSVGFAPGLMMGSGLFINTVAYVKTKDPAGFINGVKSSMQSVNGMAMQGMSFEGKFTPEATKVSDVSVDAWEMKITPPEDNPMAGQMMMMMYGAAGGPTGYLAKADGGVIQTFSKNSMLMAAALDAAKGKNTMEGDATVAQVAERLPKGRVFEGYLGVKSLMDMVGPMMAMMGGPQMQVPENLPPIGMGLGASDGSARFGLFVPAQVIKTAADIAKSFQESMGGGMDEMEDEEAAPADPKPAGQPRF
ncbi:MAG: hypothetical protein H7Y88_03890 [Phycisphaerales bacterium]|nr:hypothetical protein [Phycisphaerales bacterium]